MNSNYSKSDLHALLVLNALAMGSTGRWIALIRQSMPPAAILELILQEDLFGKREALEKLLQSFDSHQELERCEQDGIQIISLFDERYPPLLKEMTDPPLVLYVRGTWTFSDQNAVAVVGSRHPSFYGRMQAQRFSQKIAEAGLTVISGLARGIDQIAHEAALTIAWGRTVAVLGSGLDVLYPPESKGLADRILKQGSIMTEFPLGTKPFAGNFPRRNRIIAGLALAVLVVEAHKKSGSLITARLALEQGRDVFAIPGPVDQITSGGTNGLIKEGAYLAESPEDVITQLPRDLIFLEKGEDSLESTQTCSVNAKEVQPELLFSDDQRRLRDLLQKGPLFFDEIADFAKLSPQSLAPLLVEMELKTLVQKKKDGRFALV